MRAAKLRILLCVVFLVILALVSIAIRFRTTPVVPTISLPPNVPVAVGTPLPPPPPVSPTPSTSTFVGIADLIIPVAGVRPEQLIDTFDDARSEGRVHDAIDIPAAAELPSLRRPAARFRSSFKANAAARQSTNSARSETDLLYAHLSHYADNLAEGDIVYQGQVIAYVGDTGNAGAGNYHLHFSIANVSDPKRYWEGTSINPYPLLQNRAR